MEQTQLEQHEAPERSRSRTHTWDDPSASAAALGAMSGLEMLLAIGDGRLPTPPIMSTLAFGPAEAEEGRVVFTLRPAEFHLNPLGTVHGGVISTLLDTAAACAVHSTLPAGTGYTTVDLTSTFLRPVRASDGVLRAVGTVLSRGRRTALGQAQVLDERDRLVAHATSTCLLLPLGAPGGG
jgi:uncharacterized protein (TIGR00369 family)